MHHEGSVDGQSSADADPSEGSHGTQALSLQNPLPMIAGGRLHTTNKRRGHYLGTEIDEKWWRRYSGDGLLARGVGEFWIDGPALFFRRFLTEDPIIIFFGDVIDVKVGRWHSGRWAVGSPVVKIVWRKAGTRLSSGFVFSRKTQETQTLVKEIRSHL